MVFCQSTIHLQNESDFLGNNSTLPEAKVRTFSAIASHTPDADTNIRVTHSFYRHIDNAISTNT
ncbi:MAG: hypothetical protein KME25_20185 [Symplocastrum torsivum CPER-KK1]|uniref:Uncharacterized protein n=1 Tax=Symplocastrum torsivum CPER-KK1 TaxID=450513 RepID=A0A951PP47_9CYAN|nr:hypothetical protein [Symplocastrum torsivum CPER-KK1]